MSLAKRYLSDGITLPRQHPKQPMSNKQIMIVELSPEHAIGLQHMPMAKDMLLIQGIKKAIVKLHGTEVDVIILDFGTHGGPTQSVSPVDACRQLAAASPNARIIAIGATDDHLAAQLLLPNVYDVLAYPSETTALPYAVQRARRLQQIRQQNQTTTRNRPLSELIPGIMSADAAMRRVIKRSKRLTGHNLRILIQGEPGTGRKTLANYFAQHTGRLHGGDAASAGSVQPPIISCNRYTRGIDIEVVLRKAVAEQTGNTPAIVILENIEQLDPTTQTELLYLIHNSETRWKDVNSLPQIISIASPALGARIVDGQFRRDLYDRLGQVHLCLPALRQRGEDAVELARWMVDQHNQQNAGAPRMVLADDAVQAISRYSWHGNIAELQNIIQQALITADGVLIQAADLGLPANETMPPITIKHARDEAERDAIHRALKDANDNIAKAAITLGVSRPTLYDLLAKHQLR